MLIIFVGYILHEIGNIVDYLVKKMSKFDYNKIGNIVDYLVKKMPKYEYN